MTQPFRVVVIGGVAAGPKIASKARRLRPDAKITVIERSDIISYAGCGLPYYISGVVHEQKDLVATPAGAVRDAAFFKNVKNINVLARTKALEIDRQGKRVRIQRLEDGSESWIEYDKLALATGGRPVAPPIPGADVSNVFTLKTIADAEAIKQLVEEGKAKDVVIVGAGLIGMEMAEALVAKGVRVTMIEMLSQILAPLDREMALLVEKHLAHKGIRLLLRTTIGAIEKRAEIPTDKELCVVTSRGGLFGSFIIKEMDKALEKEEGNALEETDKASETSETVGGNPFATLKFIKLLFKQAFQEHATEICVTPDGDSLMVQYLIGGVWESMPSPPQRWRKHIVEVLETLLDTHEPGRLLPREKQVNLVLQNQVNCDAVIFAVGIRPNVELATAAGLAVGPTGAIQVDDHLRTSDPDIYAAGDCVEVTNIITGKPAYCPLGSTSNKQGRVAAINLCGGDETFPGVLGSTILKVFDYNVGWTGLNEKAARDAGYDAVTCLVPSPDKAHYFPTKKMLMLKMIADRKTGRLLGLQGIGPGDVARRLDVATTAITAGMTVDQVSKLDLCYAPPFSAAMDNLITAANVIENKIEGWMDGISPLDLESATAEEDILLLDVRTPDEFAEKRLRGAVHIPLGALRKRAGELPRDRPIVVYCGSSLRAYEGALILRAAGFEHVRVLDGSLAMWPYEMEKA